MIMSLIIILPLISAETWFNKDPTVDQLVENYFSQVKVLNSSEAVVSFLSDMVAAANEGEYPILSLHVTTSIGNFSYPSELLPAQS